MEFSQLGNGFRVGVFLGIGIVVLVLVSGVLQSSNTPENVVKIVNNTVEDFVEIGKESIPVVLDAGELVCNIDEILIDKIVITGIHDQMLLNVEGKSKEILTKWKISGRVTACEVAILDDILPKDTMGKIWRNQAGITNAMKNIQACTLIECANEYEIIKYLEEEK